MKAIITLKNSFQVRYQKISDMTFHTRYDTVTELHVVGTYERREGDLDIESELISDVFRLDKRFMDAVDKIEFLY